MHTKHASAIAVAITLCAFMGSSVAQPDRLPSFPGAEGNGSATPGGRGGDVYLVTSLADSGPGSLREGCEAEGSRIVVVAVSGIIELESPIEIRHPFVTVAGQKAPGDGICLKNYGLQISANDVVIRYLRVRTGDGAGTLINGIDINGERVIVDHCSVSWTTGAAVSVSGASRDVTLQWCIFGESLYDPAAAEGKQGVGVAIDAAEGTFSLHHNYFAHLRTGIPNLGGTGDAPGPILDFRNNIVYDWGVAAGDAGDAASRINLLNNIYKAGPSTSEEKRGQAFRLRSYDAKIHFDGNELVGSEMGSATNFLLLQMPDEFSNRHHSGMLHIEGPFEADPVDTQPTRPLLERVLTGSGANLPRRDAVDRRITSAFRLGTGEMRSTAGDWPEFEAVEPPQDSDSDGMPDEWERSFDLNPSDKADAALDLDGDGYTNIEEFLNSTRP